MGESAAKYRPELDLDEFERRLRAAAPSPQTRQTPQSAPDPLAELARLVSGAGEGGRQDPFDALFRAQKAVAETRPAPIEAPHEPYFGGSAPGVGNPQGYAETEPHWATDSAAEASWAGQGQDYAPQADDYARQMRESGARGGNRKVLYAMAAVLVAGVAVFAGGLAMKKGSGNGDVVTIQADSDPAKIKPATQENAGSGSGQALFDHKDDNAPAKVVASSEHPADLGAAAKQAQAATAAKQAKAAAAAGVPTPAPPAPVSGAAQVVQGQGAQGDGVVMAPKKVKTVSVRADGSLLNGVDALPRSTLPSLAAGFPGAPSALPMGGVKPAAPRVADHSAPSTTEAALHAPAKPKPAVAVADPASTASVSTGDWAVQLSSEPGEAEARASATRYAAKYGAALQGRHPTFASAQLGERTVYRVRIGHLAKDSADGICNAIKGQGGACFIVKN
jgi:hypothetical protein